MKLLKWLSVAERFSKAYLDQLLAPLGINSSQHIYLLKVCDHPGISQDALLDIVYVHPSNMVRMVASLEKKGFLTREPVHRTSGPGSSIPPSGPWTSAGRSGKPAKKRKQSCWRE